MPWSNRQVYYDRGLVFFTFRKIVPISISLCTQTGTYLTKRKVSVSYPDRSTLLFHPQSILILAFIRAVLLARFCSNPGKSQINGIRLIQNLPKNYLSALFGAKKFHHADDSVKGATGVEIVLNNSKVKRQWEHLANQNNKATPVTSHYCRIPVPLPTLLSRK